MMRCYLVILLFGFLLTNCLGGLDKHGTVKSFYNGIVQTKGGSFALGELPVTWKRRKIKFHALLFENLDDKSTITIDSFCKGSVDGGSLEDLTRKLLRSIQNVKISSRKKHQLSNREALQTVFTGTVDGRTIFSDIYVLKMNECVFDFIYLSYPDQNQHRVDFEAMVQGFRYIDGPEPI